MATDLGRECAHAFNATSLNEIADAAELFGQSLRAEARAVNERDGLEACKPYLHEADCLRLLAHYARQIVAMQNGTEELRP